MSSLLEQAIIDAAALKEAALKNAEASVIEKYSVEVKEALKSLLEAEEDQMAGMADPSMDMGAAPPVEEPLKNIPSAATEGEKLCACKEEDEKIEIDLDAIAKKLSDTESGEPISGNSFGQTGASATGIPLNPQQQAGLGEGYYRIDRNILKESTSNDVVLEFNKNELLSMLEEDTQLSIGGLSDKDIPNNVGNDKRFKGESWSLGGPSNHTQDAIKLSKAQVAAAKEEAEAAKKELEKARKERDKTNKSLETLEEHKAVLSKRLEQYENVVSVLKEKLDSFALSNAKLLYVNRVLSNVSLNERQKTTVVEKLSNAKTPDEAKTIFETLQSSVQSANTNAAPKSLNEAVTRNVISSISGRREQEIAHVPELERLQILAGIKK
jgi:hypothetical protein